jgi:hypothetical protein
MKEVSTQQKNGFTDFMVKMEQVGFLLLNQESVIKDERQQTRIPEPFRGFINGQDLI